MTTWTAVWAEHALNVGWVEGPSNQNPWGPEQGVKNAAYCASAATTIPYHHGVRWWADAQFGERGYAYSPYVVNGARAHSVWKDEKPDQPVDLVPGDIVTFSWKRNGVADHTETVVAVYADFTFDTIGYNTGVPEGCHYPIRRNRKYLMGRLRMQGTFYDNNVPTPPLPPGGTVKPDYVPAVAMIGGVVSAWVPPEGGLLQFTDAGFVYAWAGAQYHGGPGGDPNTQWRAGRRVGATIGPPRDGAGNPVPGHYSCIDTAGEIYTY